MKLYHNIFRKNSTIVVIFFSYLVVFSFVSVIPVQAQNSTFLTLTGKNHFDVENSERLQLEKFTISTWFRTDKTDYEHPGTIVNKGGMNDDDLGKNMNYGLWITEDEKIEGGFETDDGVNFFVTSTHKYNDGRWHHVLLTYDGNKLTLYVDRQVVSSLTTDDATPDIHGNQLIRIGANSLELDKFFTGDVDEVVIWERSLNDAEISDLFTFDELPSSGQLIYLPFSSSSSFSSKYDYSPYLALDGSEKIVQDRDDDLFNLSEFSLVSWFRLDRINHEDPGVFIERGGFDSEEPGQNLNYGLWYNPSETIQGGFETSLGTNVFISSPGKYNDGFWHHAILTFDKKELKLYIDGTLVNSKIISEIEPDINSDENVIIGGSSDDSLYFKGDLDEIRIFDRSLNSEEVIQAYNNNTYDSNGQLLYLPFDELDQDDTGTDTGTGSGGNGTDTGTGSGGNGTDTGTGSGGNGTDTGTGSGGNGTDTGTGSGGNGTDTGTGSGGNGTDTGTGSGGNGTDTGTGSGGNGTDTGTGSGGNGTDTGTGSGGNGTDTGTGSGGNGTDTGTGSGGNGTDTGTGSGGNGTDTGSDINVINRAGFLVVVTNVVNDDNGIKNSQDFRLHILNGSALPSTFTGSPSPNGQIVAVEEGPYTVGVSNTDGYEVDFQYDCSGFINERDIKVCSVNLDDISSDSPGTGSGGNGTDTGTGSGGNGTDTGTGSGGNGTDTGTGSGGNGTDTGTGSGGNGTDTGTGSGGNGTDTGTGSGGNGTDTGTGSDDDTSTFNDFNIAAAGDWGCNSNSRATAASILSTSPEIVLGLGDYSYKSTGLCWLDVISAINDQMKISIGNHDGEPKEDEQLTEDYLEHFFSDIFKDNRKQYHSFTFENVFFIAMATDISYSTGSSQHNFVTTELEKASEDENVDWIVVYYHRPTYSSPSKHAGLSEFRNIYHPLFDKYNVDLVLAGHNHNYQRTYPITYNPSDPRDPILTSSEKNNYTNIQAPIFITSGTGGVSLYNLKSQADFTIEQYERYGHLNIDVINSNGKKLVGKFIDNDGDVLDHFTIIKSNGSSPPVDDNGDNNTPPSTNNTELDVFGIQQIYPSKAGGEEWFMNMIDATNDARLELRGGVDNVVKSTIGSDADFDWTDVDDNQDYAWTPIPSDKVRLVAYTSDSRENCDPASKCAKFDQTNMQEFLDTKDNRQIYDLTKLSQVGHWFSDRDWTNIEMTGYFKLLSTDDDSKGYSIFSRSIGHDSEVSGCGGATPKFNIGFDGELQMRKEMWHVSQVRDDSIKDNDLSSSIEGKWIGIKTIIYNLPENQGVKMETWLDKNNNGKFVKAHEFLETSGFGERGTSGPEKCNGEWDQLYTWGSPKAVWRWDDSVSLFKFLSVREIIPPSNN